MDAKYILEVIRTPSWKRSLFARRAIALCLAVLAVMVGWKSAVRTDPEFVVIVREVSAGTTIAEADVSSRQFPSDSTPADAFSKASDVVGKTASTALKPNDLISARDVMSTDLADALLPYSEGNSQNALVPVRLLDPASAALIYPGVTVDIIGSKNEVSEVIARGGRVVFATERESGKLGAGTVLVALPQSSAHAVASANLQHPLTVVVSN